MEYMNQLSQGEGERMADVIRRLYDQTFLLEQTFDRKTNRMVSNKDYFFCEQHFEFLADYFAVAGIDLKIDPQLGTIYVSPGSGSFARLGKLSTIYLLVLKLIYDEQMAQASSSATIHTTFGELNAKIGEFQLLSALSSVSEIRSALRTLRKYQLIDLTDTYEDLNEMTRIIIHPSINLVLLREDIIGLLESFGEEGTEEAVQDGE